MLIIWKPHLRTTPTFANHNNINVISWAKFLIVYKELGMEVKAYSHFFFFELLNLFYFHILHGLICLSQHYIIFVAINYVQLKRLKKQNHANLNLGIVGTNMVPEV